MKKSLKRRFLWTIVFVAIYMGVVPLSLGQIALVGRPPVHSTNTPNYQKIVTAMNQRGSNLPLPFIGTPPSAADMQGLRNATESLVSNSPSAKGITLGPFTSEAEAWAAISSPPPLGEPTQNPDGSAAVIMPLPGELFTKVPSKFTKTGNAIRTNNFSGGTVTAYIPLAPTKNALTASAGMIGNIIGMTIMATDPPPAQITSSEMPNLPIHFEELVIVLGQITTWTNIGNVSAYVENYYLDETHYNSSEDLTGSYQIIEDYVSGTGIGYYLYTDYTVDPSVSGVVEFDISDEVIQQSSGGIIAFSGAIWLTSGIEKSSGHRTAYIEITSLPANPYNFPRFMFTLFNYTYYYTREWVDDIDPLFADGFYDNRFDFLVGVPYEGLKDDLLPDYPIGIPEIEPYGTLPNSNEERKNLAHKGTKIYELGMYDLIALLDLPCDNGACGGSSNSAGVQVLAVPSGSWSSSGGVIASRENKNSGSYVASLGDVPFIEYGSGSSNGLRVEGQMTLTVYNGYVFQGYNLDSKIGQTYVGTENNGDEWEFINYVQPNGMHEILGWVWENGQKVYAMPTRESAGNYKLYKTYDEEQVHSGYKVIFPGQETYTYYYDLNGDLTRIRKQSFENGKYNDQYADIASLGITTQYTNDSNGIPRLTRVDNSNGHTEFTYNADGVLTETRYYDLVNNLVRKISTTIGSGVGPGSYDPSTQTPADNQWVWSMIKYFAADGSLESAKATFSNMETHATVIQEYNVNGSSITSVAKQTTHTKEFIKSNPLATEEEEALKLHSSYISPSPNPSEPIFLKMDSAMAEDGYTFAYDSSTGSYIIYDANGQATEYGSLTYETETLELPINVSFDGLNPSKDYFVNTTITVGSETVQARALYKTFEWGNGMIESVIAPDTEDEQTTRYGYYDDGKLKYIQNHDGSWVMYAYDNKDRVIAVAEPFGNTVRPEAVPSASQGYKVTSYSYTPVAPADLPLDNDQIPRTVVNSINGAEISRTYTVVQDDQFQTIVCTQAGAAYTAMSNLVTTTYLYPSTHAFAGRTSKVTHPDGRLTTYSYSSDGTNLTTTIRTGSGDGTTVSDGIRTVIVTDAAGNETSRLVYDITSGLEISNAAFTCDYWGRVIRADFGDNTYMTTTYACCGPSQIRSREGIAADMTYDALKQLTSRAVAGVSKLYQYNAFGLPKTSTTKGSAGAELTTSIAYNQAGDITSITVPGDRETTFTEVFNEDGSRVTTTTLPDGGTKIQTYNRDGTLAEEAGTAVRHVKYEYGIDNGELFVKKINVAEEDDESNWTKSYLNFFGKVYKVVYADSSFAEIGYQYGRPVSYTTPAGTRHILEYNAKGEVVKQAIDMNDDGYINDSGIDRIIAYETSFVSRDNKVAKRKITKAYDTLNSSSTVTVKQDDTGVYGSNIWESDFGRADKNTTVSYDGSGGKTITVTNPDGSTVTSNYTNGLMTSSVHSVLGTTSYTYDEFNRVATVTRTIDGQTRTTTYAYNSVGQLASITAPDNRVTSFTYDSMGRRASITKPGSRTIDYTYHPTGEIATVSGADTYPQSYTYDALGRMKTLTTYKAHPNEPEVTTWGYDALRGFMTTRTFPDGKSASYLNNADGEVTKRTWARGITTDYTLNPVGQITNIDYSDATADITLIRNRLGRITSVTDAAGTRTLTYNPDTSPASEQFPYIQSGIGKLEYVYDALGRRSGMSLKEGAVAKFNHSYTYDAMSRVATVLDGIDTFTNTYLSGSNLLSSVVATNSSGAIMTTSKTYDTAKRLLSTSAAFTGGGRSYTYEYNDKDQRTKLTLADGSYWLYTYDDKGQVTGGVKYDAQDTVIPGQSFGYAYDDIGNRTTMDNSGLNYVYTSNDLNQYTQMTIPGILRITGRAVPETKITVTKGSSGSVVNTTRTGAFFQADIPVDNSSGKVTENLTMSAVKYDPAQDKDVVATASRFGSVDKTPKLFTYDDDGNMLTNGDWIYAWNGENRLITAESATKKLEFAYDYKGRRIYKKVYTGTTGNWTLAAYKKFVYDNFVQIAEYDAMTSDTLKKSYLRGLDESLLNVNDNGTRYYYNIDGNKNVRSMIDGGGTVVAEYEYSPFGKLIGRRGLYSLENPFRFSSEYHDDETGLVYFNYRYYSTELGRWLSRDPLNEKGGANLYAMVENNAINLWDRLGLCEKLKKGMDATAKAMEQMLDAMVDAGSWTWNTTTDFISSSAEEIWGNEYLGLKALGMDIGAFVTGMLYNATTLGVYAPLTLGSSALSLFDGDWERTELYLTRFSDALVPRYGFFLGPGHGVKRYEWPFGELFPFNNVDIKCKIHDIDHLNNQRQGDLRWISTWHSSGPLGQLFQSIGTALFGTRLFLDSIGIDTYGPDGTDIYRDIYGY